MPKVSSEKFKKDPSEVSYEKLSRKSIFILLNVVFVKTCSWAIATMPVKSEKLSKKNAESR